MFESKDLSKVVQEAGSRFNVGPVTLLPDWVYPLVTVALPCLALYQNYIRVFLGPSEPLGQNTAVALIHKQQNTGRFATSQIS